MKYRITVFAYCFVGCLIAALVSFLVHLKFGVPIFAFLLFCTVTLIACYAGGLRNRKTLIMIGIYATIGFGVGGMMQPVTVIAPSRQAAWNARKPLGGKEEIIPCILLGSVFALGRCAFLPLPPRDPVDKQAGS